MAFELASDMPPRGNLYGVIAQPVSLPRHGTKYNTQPDLTGIFTMANVLAPLFPRGLSQSNSSRFMQLDRLF